ncbi:MAG: AMP-binding protein, partial [Caulobacteraceae bacterium]
SSTTPRTQSDLAAICYTSGTTGRSKGAMLSGGNLLSNARTLAGLWRFSERDRLIHALPLFHVHGLFIACHVSLLSGAAILLQPRFSPSAVIEAMARASVLMGVPTFYTRLLAEPGLDRERAGRMRLFISGSAPLLASTHAAWRERTGAAILERYGLTETGMNASNPYDGERVAGTVGPPLPGVELRIVGEDGAELRSGEVGMVEVKGPNVFSGYWRDPEKSRAAFTADGFFITGDLGRLDEAGYLSIVGRAKDLVISGGLNITPLEVEQEIDALEGVIESALLGLPHGDLGEAAVAFVVADPACRLDEDAIVSAIAPRLARYKQPRRIVFVRELPRNAMGKVQKAELRRSYARLFD